MSSKSLTKTEETATVHRLHPFDPKNKAVIRRRWQEVRKTKCPIKWVEDSNNFEYLAEYVEYTFINKKGKEVYVPEMMLWCEDLRDGKNG